MKKLLQLAILSSVIISSPVVAQESQGYKQLKNLVTTSEGQMKTLTMYSLLINATATDIKTSCPVETTTKDISCSIPTGLAVIVTEDMKAQDEYGDLPAVGVSMPLPLTSASITYLSEGVFDNALSMTLTDGTKQVFRWNNDGTIKAVSYQGEDNEGVFKGSTSVQLVNGNVEFKDDGEFNVGNTTYTFKLTLQQTDVANNGVKVKASFQADDGANKNSFDIIGNANDDGGFVQTTMKYLGNTFIEKETFNGNGNSVNFAYNDGSGWRDANDNTTNDITPDTEYEVDLGDFESTNYIATTTGTVAYSPTATITEDIIGLIIVKAGDTPRADGSNFLGGGIYGDLDQDSTKDVELDYFGENTLLGSCGGSDDDGLDIYEQASTFKQVVNICLQSPQ